jgi:hypothetical protein
MRMNKKEIISEMFDELDRFKKTLLKYEATCNKPYNKDRSACKRASMDLTRKLAEFRKTLII